MEIVGENDRSKANLIVAPVPVRPLVGCNGFLHSAWPWPVVPPSFHNHISPYQPSTISTNQINFVNSIFPSMFAGGPHNHQHQNGFGSIVDPLFLSKNLPTTSTMKHNHHHTSYGYGSLVETMRQYEFRCAHCRKNYNSAPAFHMHLRTHMQGCECPICGKNFSRHWLLQGHIRTHTGEKPFRCHICSKAFADKSNLRAHIQTHSGVKPFVCSRCGKAFALKSYLSKHEESACVKSVS